MTEFSENRRAYTDALKYRCVDRATIFPDSVRDDVRERYFSSGRLNTSAFERYWRARRASVPPAAATERAITNNYSFLFNRAGPPFAPGRFNTSSFPALYTAKEPETALKERFYYLKGTTRPFEWVLYSVFVTAEVVDLRPLVATGNFKLDDSHDACRETAERLRARVDGIAWSSVRIAGGSCCAFFAIAGVKPNAIEHSGIEPPPVA